MQIKVCFVYPWATFGGCERVFINRALAFKQYLPETTVDFYFMQDAGGLSAFSSALKEYQLNGSASLVDSLDREYDLISLVDCPQAIDVCSKKAAPYIVECHTPYEENRKYLFDLPEKCKFIVTPSMSFSKLVKNEFPSLADSVVVLRNFVPWDISLSRANSNIELPAWSRKPILFFARMDKLKDPISLLDAFEVLEKRRKKEFMLLFCGPLSPEINVHKEISKRKLDGVSVVLPPIPFASAEALMNAVASAGGVFVSPSRGESFGLSAAEAISSVMPVALSDINEHADLVGNHKALFTYPLGDREALTDRIEYLFDHYADARNAAMQARNAFSAKSFIEDWISLLDRMGIKK